MQRTFTVETSMEDEKALLFIHRSEMLEFAFNSTLASFVNSARGQFVSAAKELAAKEGRPLIGDDDLIISITTLPTADDRHAEAVAWAKAEADRIAAEAEAKATADAEAAALKQKAEDERIAALVAAQVAAIIGAQNPPPPEGEPAT